MESDMQEHMEMWRKEGQKNRMITYRNLKVEEAKDFWNFKRLYKQRNWN